MLIRLVRKTRYSNPCKVKRNICSQFKGLHQQQHREPEPMANITGAKSSLGMPRILSCLLAARGRLISWIAGCKSVCVSVSEWVLFHIKMWVWYTVWTKISLKQMKWPLLFLSFIHSPALTSTNKKWVTGQTCPTSSLGKPEIQRAANVFFRDILSNTCDLWWRTRVLGLHDMSWCTPVCGSAIWPCRIRRTDRGLPKFFFFLHVSISVGTWHWFVVYLFAVL